MKTSKPIITADDEIRYIYSQQMPYNVNTRQAYELALALAKRIDILEEKLNDLTK